jgi:hypothetical protein
VIDEKESRGPGVKWNAFEEIGEAAVKTLRWPWHWPKPSDDLLAELGWKWDDIKPNRATP